MPDNSPIKPDPRKPQQKAPPAKKEHPVKPSTKKSK